MVPREIRVVLGNSHDYSLLLQARFPYIAVVMYLLGDGDYFQDS
jgi:hypothetical protein